MNIAETIYHHVMVMPPVKALEVLEFIEHIEKIPTPIETPSIKNELLEFIQTLPAKKHRTDININQQFQALRNEW
jgi:hypothetical protein